LQFEIKVEKGFDEKKIEKVIKENIPTVPMSIIFKMLRKGQVKINNRYAKIGQIITNGDIIAFDIEEKYLKQRSIQITKIYEDDNIIIIDKPYGIPSHPDTNKEFSVVDWIKEEYGKEEFLPSLCHRLDRNTSGLMMIAKNRQALNEMLKYISRRAIKKKYLCITKKAKVKNSDVLIHYLKKDEKKGAVFVSEIPKQGCSKMVTKYSIVKQTDSFYLLDVEIETGKTHQIRAQLSFIGLPILGDNKYGDWKLNRLYNAEYQCLCAYYLGFDIGKKGILSYLDGSHVVKEMVEFPVNIEGLNVINVYKERGIRI